MEKKFRTFLIIVAVMLSGAVYFASASITDSLVAVYTKKAKLNVGNAEIVILPNVNSPSQFIGLSASSKAKQPFDYTVPLLRGSGLYAIGQSRYDQMSLMGIELEDYKAMNELVFKRVEQDKTLTGSYAIISDKTAQSYKLDIGDELELRINDKKRRLIIYGISEAVGVFANEGETPLVMISFNTLSGYMETQNKPNAIYIKGELGTTPQQIITELQGLYPKYTVREAISEADLGDYVFWIELPLMMMTIMVTFMSIFIIYTSFKVIMIEKLPIVGTFRSVGASKKMMNRVLLLESTFYGVIGGIGSNLLGVIVLAVMIRFMANTEGLKPEMVIKPTHLLISFFLGVTICLISSFIPIRSTAKIPIKEVVLGNHTSYKKKKRYKYILGVFLILISIIIPKLELVQMGLLLSIISMIAAIVGVINILPLSIHYSLPFIKVVFTKLFGNVGSLAARNVKGNKSMTNSMALIAIGVGIILMLNNVSQNLREGLLEIYETSLVFNIGLQTHNMDKYKIRSIRGIEGVESVYGYYITGDYEGEDIPVKEFGGKSIHGMHSVSGPEFDGYLKLTYKNEEEKQRLLTQLNKERCIVVTNLLKKRYNLKEGDVLTLTMPEGDREYTLIGFVDTPIYSGGYAMMGEKYMGQDLGLSQYNGIYVNTNKEEGEVLEVIKEKYKKEQLQGDTNAEFAQSEQESNDVIMTMLKGFCVLAIVIGIIGIVNNLLISFIERKKGFAILRSVGMSQKQITHMIFIEAIYLGLLGAISGIAIGWLLMGNMEYVLVNMDMPFGMKFIADGMGLYIGATLMLTIIASTVPAQKTSKLNIIEAIKYE